MACFIERSDQNKSVVSGTEAQGHDSLGVLIGFRPFDSGVGSYSDISIYSTIAFELHYCLYALDNGLETKLRERKRY
jgi:hypothetical protein